MYKPSCVYLKWTWYKNESSSLLHCFWRWIRPSPRRFTNFVLSGGMTWPKCKIETSGSLYLYTTELGTTPPPELSISRLLYIRFRQNRLRYYMIKRTKVHHWLCRKMVLHGKQEYCTSQNKGILYITVIRNIVHHRKQEYCTSLKSGILYITEKKEFCTTEKTGILYNTEIRNIVHHWYAEECKWA